MREFLRDEALLFTDGFFKVCRCMSVSQGVGVCGSVEARACACGHAFATCSIVCSRIFWWRDVVHTVMHLIRSSCFIKIDKDQHGRVPALLRHVLSR